MGNIDRRNGYKYVIKVIIGILIYVIFAFWLTPPAPISALGMKAIACFFLAIYLWLFFDVGWGSFFIIGLVGVSGLLPVNDAIKASWGHWIVPFVSGCFLINYTLRQTGFLRRVAVWFVTRKFVRNRPWAFTTMFLAACFLVGSFMPCTSTTVVFMALAEEIFTSAGFEKGDRYPECIYAAISWVTAATSGGTPISHPYNLMIMGLILSDFGHEITILRMSIVGTAVALFFTAVCILMFKYWIKPDVSKLRDIDLTGMKESLAPMSKREKAVVIIFGIVVACWILPEFFTYIPGLSMVGAVLKKLGSTVPVIFAVALLGVIKIDGAPLLNFAEGVKNVSWASVLLAGTVMLLGGCLTSSEGGVSAFLSSKLTAVTSNLTGLAFVAVVIAWVILQTNFMSNAVCAMLYVVVAPVAAATLGVNAIALGMMIGSAANYGLATASATAQTSIVLGSGWLTPGFLFKYGMVMALVAIIGYIFIGYPLGCLIL